MKKLELKDISCYLPYRLQCVNMVGNSVTVTVGYDYDNHKEKHVDNMLYSQCKPILRPMSDITKSITVRGYNEDKEFIPIINLAKVNYLIAPKSDDDYELLDGDNGYQCSFIYSPWKDRKRRFCFQIYKNGDIQCFSCDVRSYTGESNTAKYCNVSINGVMELLSKWHFDYKGLITDGLAIDINKVELK